MLVICVGEKRMRVRDGRVPVPMGVARAGWPWRGVVVFVVRTPAPWFIVVFKGLVGMFVLVVLGQVQRDAHRHQCPAQQQAQGHGFIEQRQRH
jgi:hypothetical protein